MLVKIHEENPSPKQIQKVVECLLNGGIVIYPTDTVYGIGCSIFKSKSVEKVAAIKGIPINKANFSLICNDLSNISLYSKPLNNNVYKIMKKCLPGAYTFIVNASSNVPKIFMSKKKTVGIRVPDNNIIQTIVAELGHPIMSTSVEIDEEVENTVNPELIYEKYKNQVDIVIDGGYGDIVGSTIIDCTEDDIVVVREGKGSVDFSL
jgi:tRNA threonylcarbamoyl adenosine modification protein (Sua5/YciO/YrdC/YwlC family)